MPRKKPFSNKQKKRQLQIKKQSKKDKCERGNELCRPDPEEEDSEEEEENTSDDTSPTKAPLVISKIDHQPTKSGHYDPNRFRLHFEQESREELEKRKRDAKRLPIVPVDESTLEVGIEDIYHPGSFLDMPKRPPWDYSKSKAEVEQREEQMFMSYLDQIHSHYPSDQLSYFEHNLETWRQLWRVLELSNVVLLIADIRHPVLHFPPALYTHVIDDLKKQLILVLNKVDLVPPQIVIAWKYYFMNKFPHLNIICFTSYPNKDVSLEHNKKVKMRFRRRGGKMLSAVGPRELFHVIEELYRGQIDMTSWQQHLDTKSDEEITEVSSHEVPHSILTIGLVGHPNVGKSSILNGLMGKKTVSISRTPGHTKHLQTIFLTPTIRLCDCPGLVFPSLINKQLQILSGIYPISQVREPYTSVGYLAERVPIIDLLQLSNPNYDPLPSQEKTRKSSEDEDDEYKYDATCISHQNFPSVTEQVWTPWDICDAWAERRGYYTAKAARLDTYRAANSLLRLAADGRITLFFRPPGYSKEKERWEHHPEVSEMIALQQEGMIEASSIPLDQMSSTSSDSDDIVKEKIIETPNKDSTVQLNKFTMLIDFEEDNNG